MTELSISVINSENRVDSRLLAGELDHRHRTILENIDKYQGQFESLGALPFETEKGQALVHGGFGKSTRYAMLNEDQSYFLLSLMRNNELVVSLKLKLVKAFSDSRKQLAERDVARLDGKQVRRLETDAIKNLVDYAKASGSGRSEMYYTNITKMTNSALGIESGQRDLMDARQLQLLKLAETMIEIAINDGLKAKFHYKDIYKLCKDRVTSIIDQLKIS